MLLMILAQVEKINLRNRQQ